MRLALVLVSLLALPVVPDVSAQESSWPVGRLFVDYADAEPAPFLGDCSGPEVLDPLGPTDFVLGARIDFAAIDRAELNGSDGMSGWQAELELFQTELLEVELFPAGAVDRDPDPLRFDVVLPETVTGTDIVVLARVRVQSTGTHPPTLRFHGTGDRFAPATWSTAGSTDDCPSPCTRPFQRASQPFVELGAVAYCIPDNCSGHIERPVGGEDWTVGETETVLFSLTAGQYRIEFSPDAGATWQTISGGYATQEFFHWTIPNTPTDDAMLRLCIFCVANICDEPVSFRLLDPVRSTESSFGALKARF